MERWTKLDREGVAEIYQKEGIEPGKIPYKPETFIPFM